MTQTIRTKKLTALSYPSGGGDAAPVDLLRGVKGHAAYLRIAASFTITGSSGGAVVAGGTLNMINTLTLVENGDPQITVTGALLAYLTSRDQHQPAHVVDISAATAGTYSASADIILPFATLIGADPAETCYVDTDARFPTQLGVNFASASDGVIISGTGSAVNSYTITPTHEYDPVTQVMPFFLPRIRRLTSNPVTGTQTNFTFNLTFQPGRRVESIILRAVTDGATNASVFNGNISFIGDKFNYVDTVDINTVLNWQRRFTPGVSSPTLGIIEIPTRKYGKLSEMFVTGQDSNPRILVDVTNPGTNTKLEAYLIEREPIANFTRALPQGW